MKTKKPTNENLARYYEKSYGYISNLRTSMTTGDKRHYIALKKAFTEAHKGQECKK